jgi:protease IV
MKIIRESIFVASIRIFCSSFAAILGVIIGIILIFIIISFFSGPKIYPEKSLMQIEPDANDRVELLSEGSPAILRMDFHGVIGDGDITSQKIEKILRESREDMLKNDRVRAVILHMNTPGGEVSNADGIYRALLEYKQKYKVPIYAYVDGLCASGGMYIACAADKIYATPTSVIGSVGIILGPAFNFSQAMDKIGMQSLTLTQGKDKDMLNPFRPWQEGEYESLEAILASLYDQFLNVVSSARPKLSKEKLTNDYGAQVYVSGEAQTLGYIDVACSSYSAALSDLVKEAGIPEDQHYQVVTLEIPHSLIAQLIQGRSPLLSGKLTHQFQLGPNLSSELSGKFLYLYQPSGSSQQ